MKLREFNVISSTHLLLPDCAGEGAAVLALMEEQLKRAAVPGLTWRDESVEAGLLTSLFGRRRDFLVISYESVCEYQVLVCARNFGSLLDTWWILAAFPRLGAELRRTMRFSSHARDRSALGDELDLFSVMELQTFTDFTRSVVRQVVDELAKQHQVEQHIVTGSGCDEALLE